MSRQDQVAVSYPPEAGREVFDLWAQVYDAQSNPLLMLEERHAMPLFLSLSGRDVLDVGCGTGRWLRKLETLGPASLTGIDYSAAMLERARKKVRAATQLYQGDCSILPGKDNSRTFVLASFVISYLVDLHAFARECARIIRAGGWLLVSDMHPAAAAERGWKRSFHIDGANIQIAAQPRSLHEIISSFGQHGFDVERLIEPPFDTPERAVFESAGKLVDFESLTEVPAIYILKLQKRIHCSALPATPAAQGLQLTGSHLAFGPATWGRGVVRIEGEHIASISEDFKSTDPVLDLSGYSILPGLINAHDHLEFGLFPNLGRSAEAAPYQNSTEWAQEIHEVHSAIIEHHLLVPKSTRLWWGAIRNLLCGVTTVCHHNPLHPDFEVPDFPVHVVSRFGWSHSLIFDPQVPEKFRETPPEFPFILHAAEGVDRQSCDEIFQLDSMHLLGRRTVLVHGLALTPEAISLVNQRGAALITCPTSNIFLFARTLSRDLLASVKQIALGSDSSITAAGDLLDEIHYMHSNIGLDADSIYKMVTLNSAEMLRLQHRAGRITESGLADLIAVRGRHNTPASALTELTLDRVELVLLSGRVQMASQSIYKRLPQDLRSNMQLLDVAGHQRWLRAPLHALFEAAESILGKDNLLISGKQVRYV
jgi:cytosine/adenosine deaminase-related metal-dependent hydrolase/ubiquinone/menaquinone biosynthesis C-methylase UbiE